MTDDALQPDSPGGNPPLRAAVRPGPALTVLLVTALSIGFGLLLQSTLPKESITLIFLVGVLMAAAAQGVWAGVAAAVLASASINFFFIPPLFTFLVADPAELFALGVFLVAGVLTGSVAGRMRQEADAARRRAEVIGSLNDYAAHLMAATSQPDVLAAAGAQLARTLGHSVVLLVPHGEDLVTEGAWPPGIELSAEEWQAAILAWRSGRATHRPADPDPEHRFGFHPLAGARSVSAVFGIRSPPSPSADDGPTVSAILRHAGIALARLDNAEDAATARARAREEQLRNAVLTSLSHDLRTPLATILGAVTSLRELGPALPEEARVDLLSAIEDEAGRLSRYVANLLDMTRVEAGALAVARDWVDIRDVVGSAVGRARGVHPGAVYMVEVPAGLPLVETDPTLVGQILFNLLDNAAKYAGAGGPISLAASVRNGALRIAVADNGPGIAAQEQAHIFEKFRRAGPPDQRASGSGLGLAIAKGMAIALGGTLALKSPVAAGRGSRFVLSIPLSPSQDHQG
jgi:two-component system sensor histidine kinase KdpD